MSKESDISPRLLIPNQNTSKDGTINLTEAKISVISTQDLISCEHFIRGRVANKFAAAIRHYYKMNKLRKWFTPLQWSIEINKNNFLSHQST